MDNEKAEKFLIEGLLELRFTPLSEHINAFLTYLSEIKKWNKVYNLTGIQKDEDIVIKHFLDSLLYLKFIPDDRPIKIADVGSGAGFPGIPMKIMDPGIEMYLIEASGKKAAFLQHVINLLGLQKIKVIEKRVEDVEIGKDMFLVDIAVTRALFSIKKFIKKATPLVRPGGNLIVSKGPKVKDELKTLKYSEFQVTTIKLPLTHIKRYIVSITASNMNP
ncbi:MAG: 16S rRNA (guanine(527)-N(7))-methyltransferase RsmG [Nitrospirota bacterium]